MFRPAEAIGYVGKTARDSSLKVAVPVIVTTLGLVYSACGGASKASPSPTSTPTQPTYTSTPKPPEPTATPLPGCNIFPQLPGLSEAPRYMALFNRADTNFYAVSDSDGLGQYRYNVSFTDEQLAGVITKINTMNALEGQYRIPENASFSIVYDGTNTTIEYNGIVQSPPLGGRLDVSPLEGLTVESCGR